MKYSRDLLRDFEGYVPGEQPKISNVIKLNTNENPYPPSPRVAEALAAYATDHLRKYPDPVFLEFRKACAEVYGLPGPEWVFIGNGMDEVLALTVRTFVDPGDAVAVLNPTYTVYETLCDLHGARYETYDLDADEQPTEAFLSAEARLTFLTRPNAPTGVSAPMDYVERLCAGANHLVYIDEAYADFSDTNCVDLVQRYDNVIVGRTFSKAYSLAGMRLGLAMAHPDIIGEFMKTKDSYNVNVLSQVAGTAAMKDQATMRAHVEKIRATRERLTAALRTLGFTVRDSDANFVLARWHGAPDARSLYLALRDRGIFVRYFDTDGLRDALRITVGTDAEIDALLAAIEAILNA